MEDYSGDVAYSMHYFCGGQFAICHLCWSLFRLDHLSKLKTRTGLANGLSGMMLLGSVLVGVCFILTSVLLCHYWASNSTKYQAVGRIAKRSHQVLMRRRSSKPGSGGEKMKISRAPSYESPMRSPRSHFSNSPLPRIQQEDV